MNREIKQFLLLTLLTVTAATVNAYGVDDIIYTRDAKYKVTAANLVTNGELKGTSLDGWTATDASAASLSDVFTVLEGGGVSVNSGVDSLFCGMYQVVNVSENGTYVVTAKVKGAVSGHTDIDLYAAGNNYIFAYFNTDGTLATASGTNLLYGEGGKAIENCYSFTYDDYTELAFPVEAMSDGKIIIDFRGLAAGIEIKDVECHKVNAVFDERKAERYLDWIASVLGDFKWTSDYSGYDELKANMEALEGALKGYDDALKAASLEALASSFNDKFAPANLTNVLDVVNHSAGVGGDYSANWMNWTSKYDNCKNEAETQPWVFNCERWSHMTAAAGTPLQIRWARGYAYNTWDPQARLNVTLGKGSYRLGISGSGGMMTMNKDRYARSMAYDNVKVEMLLEDANESLNNVAVVKGDLSPSFERDFIGSFTLEEEKEVTILLHCYPVECPSANPGVDVTLVKPVLYKVLAKGVQSSDGAVAKVTVNRGELATVTANADHASPLVRVDVTLGTAWTGQDSLVVPIKVTAKWDPSLNARDFVGMSTANIDDNVSWDYELTIQPGNTTAQSPLWMYANRGTINTEDEGFLVEVDTNNLSSAVRDFFSGKTSSAVVKVNRSNPEVETELEPFGVERNLPREIKVKVSDAYGELHSPCRYAVYWSNSGNDSLSYYSVCTNLAATTDRELAFPVTYAETGVYTSRYYVVNMDGKPSDKHEVEVTVSEAQQKQIAVSNVVARQRWPWNGLVDIDYEIAGDADGLKTVIEVNDAANGTNWTARTFLDGFEPSAAPGRHRATWNAKADVGEGVVVSDSVTVKVKLMRESAKSVRLKVTGELPDVGKVSVRCCGWTEELPESSPITLDRDGVTVEPVATNKDIGSRLQLGVYFEQKEELVSYDNGKWNDNQDEYRWQPIYYHEDFQGGGQGAIVPECKGDESVIELGFEDDFAIDYDTLITFDLSGIDNSAWDGEDFQPNHILLAVREEDDTKFKTGPKKMRVPLRKKGTGYAPVYLRGAQPGTQYKGYYALEHLKVDGNGNIVFDGYGKATCHVIADNGDRGEVLIPEGKKQVTIKLKASNFSD